MNLDIVRAWKDENYRRSLSDEHIHTLPINPAGELELPDADLETVCGDGTPDGLGTWGGGEIVDGHPYSFALSCKNVIFSVTVITRANILTPMTIICIKADR